MKKQSLLKLARHLMRERMMFSEQVLGLFRIEHEIHKAGDNLTVVGLREAIFTGCPVTNLPLKQDTVIHKLTHAQDGTWMTDQPCEMVQMWRDLAVHARGDVLIGGLGLGILARMVAQKPCVHLVDVVERSSEVIELIRPHHNGKTSFILGDIHKFVQRVFPRQYSCVLLDTWQGTGEWVWQSEVVPLRRALAPKIRGIYCWAEGIMLGQIAQGLYRAAEMDAEALRSQSACHWYAFRRACVKVGLRSSGEVLAPNDFQRVIEVEQRNHQDGALKLFMRSFLHSVGTPTWERTFGRFWDEAWSAKEEESK